MFHHLNFQGQSLIFWPLTLTPLGHVTSVATNPLACLTRAFSANVFELFQMSSSDSEESVVYEVEQILSHRQRSVSGIFFFPPQISPPFQAKI